MLMDVKFGAEISKAAISLATCAEVRMQDGRTCQLTLMSISCMTEPPPKLNSERLWISPPVMSHGESDSSICMLDSALKDASTAVVLERKIANSQLTCSNSKAPCRAISPPLMSKNGTSKMATIRMSLPNAATRRCWEDSTS